MNKTNTPLKRSTTKKVGSVLIVGGGISGIQSALDWANSGFKVYLLEKKANCGKLHFRLLCLPNII